MAKELPELGETLADLLEILGDVPLWRIPLRPAPGTATERDVIAARHSPERWLFELADGVLILKPPGFMESVLGGLLTRELMEYLDQHDLGVCLIAAAMFRLKPGVVRIPACSFVSWETLPDGELPDAEIDDLVPDLVVEVLRPANRAREMERKVREYFEAGVRRVWLIDCAAQTAEEYAGLGEPRRLRLDDALDGGDVLPALRIPLRPLFARLRRRGPE